jgi:hypothetical protein
VGVVADQAALVERRVDLPTRLLGIVVALEAQRGGRGPEKGSELSPVRVVAVGTGLGGVVDLGFPARVGDLVTVGAQLGLRRQKQGPVLGQVGVVANGAALVRHRVVEFAPLAGDVLFDVVAGGAGFHHFADLAPLFAPLLVAGGAVPFGDRIVHAATQ